MSKHNKDWFGYGNTATGIAHKNAQGDQCRMSEVLPANRVYFKTRENFIVAVDNGQFRPCKVCASEFYEE